MVFNVRPSIIQKLVSFPPQHWNVKANQWSYL